MEHQCVRHTVSVCDERLQIANDSHKRVHVFITVIAFGATQRAWRPLHHFGDTDDITPLICVLHLNTMKYIVSTCWPNQLYIDSLVASNGAKFYKYKYLNLIKLISLKFWFENIHQCK